MLRGNGNNFVATLQHPLTTLSKIGKLPTKQAAARLFRFKDRVRRRRLAARHYVAAVDHRFGLGASKSGCFF
jgi:hypothetical protein